jgi:hypothetical protein
LGTFGQFGGKTLRLRTKVANELVVTMRVAKSEISPPREGSTKQRHFLLSFFFFDQFMSVLKLKAQVLIRSIGNVETGTASKLGKLVGPKPFGSGRRCPYTAGYSKEIL